MINASDQAPGQKKLSIGINGLVFSRDRAMQLDATLRSFYRHAQEAELVHLWVIYLATNEMHQGQYRQLQDEWAGQRRLLFFPQGKFRQDVLSVMALASQLRGGQAAHRLYHWIAGQHRRLGFLAWPLLHFPRPSAVLFLVDDNLFVRPFSLDAAVSALFSDPKALGFSLRLGRNTTYCYAVDRPQALPEFQQKPGGILSFDWTTAELDFNYSLEVSSSIYRMSDMLPALNHMRFTHPNMLDHFLYLERKRFQHRPRLLCFENSVAFCSPVNTVTDNDLNRAGVTYDYSSQELADRFTRGERIDISRYDGFVSNSCHQEIELTFRS